MCLGVILPFLLSRAAFPANSKISAEKSENTDSVFSDFNFCELQDHQEQES